MRGLGLRGAGGGIEEGGGFSVGSGSLALDSLDGLGGPEEAFGLRLIMGFREGLWYVIVALAR